MTRLLSFKQKMTWPSQETNIYDWRTKVWWKSLQHPTETSNLNGNCGILKTGRARSSPPVLGENFAFLDQLLCSIKLFFRVDKGKKALKSLADSDYKWEDCKIKACLRNVMSNLRVHPWSLKFNMEPENQPLEKEDSFWKPSFSGSMFIPCHPPQQGYPKKNTEATDYQSFKGCLVTFLANLQP